MKHKGIVFDFTSLLDVILILLFSVLVLNVGQLMEFSSKLEDSEELLDEALLELDEMTMAYEDALVRLDALSDWERERNWLLDEASAMANWRETAEEAMSFINVSVVPLGDRRFLTVSSSQGMREVEIVWAQGINAISNAAFVSEELARILAEVFAGRPEAIPRLIMFDYQGIRNQEYRLIESGITAFAADNRHLTMFYTAFSRE